jgi:predicted kinase
VLSGYPKSGKTLLANRLIADNRDFARVGVDELRIMLFNETPPSRDEFQLYTLITEMRDALLAKGYSVVIDSTAPDNVTREFLQTTRIKHVNQLLVMFTVDRDTLSKRNIEAVDNADRVRAWDKRREDPKSECCLLKFKSNNEEEFENYYARLKELLESEIHPFRPEFRPPLLPLRKVRSALRNFLEKR